VGTAHVFSRYLPGVVEFAVLTGNCGLSQPQEAGVDEPSVRQALGPGGHGAPEEGSGRSGARP
jgi:hypothetical protein